MGKTIILSIPGMMCGGCVANVEEALNSQPGVDRVDVDLDSKTARVNTDASVSDLVAAVRAAGYEAEPRN